jgi:hypothetical protein
MVVGFDKFLEHFSDHADQYALIGGAACDLLFARAGLDFRLTKDLDVVLCVEVVDKNFATAFLEFLEAGGYEARQRSDGHKEFYRFHKPKDKAYPFMIEIFSRQPNGFDLPADFAITKVPVGEDILSLSAILLDDNYYSALQESRIEIDGVSLLNEDLLIPFKAKAYLDLTDRKSEGVEVSGKDIRKHRNDVFRLAQLLPEEHRVDLEEAIRSDLRIFVEQVRDDESLDPASFDVPFSRAEGIALIENVYDL